METNTYEFTKSEINPDALQQSEMWFDRYGKRHEITAMSPYHAMNCLKKLWGAFGDPSTSTPLYKALQKRAMGK